MSKPVLLILGAGRNIAAGVASRFGAAGYAVALVSRSFPQGPATPDPETGHLRIRADLADPSQVTFAFTETRRHFGGTAPRVVVYNAASMSRPPDADNIFSLPLAQIERDVNIMSSSAWIAAGEAVRGWSEAGTEEARKGRFIYTGNLLNQTVWPVPALVTSGIGKNAAWYWVNAADALYKETKGWRFFYADERKEDGTFVGSTPGAESNGKFYLELAEGAQDLPSTVTFVDGKYKKF
ncbi:short-chain dehydrogenase/reductase SDR [Colletotrichum orchidophilum]|uniref:Short-chain dehydrogenase/reductase SDR n=1 Tax=Colletotrichum orchidophilum TaxID=1209926 RepID=A0A1G4BCG0_9PEZI|nr:short-chain dehydrogenase/reductase SDR [Colletotrichum orchidophilum]OHE99083.1 short-chain dehydrogenase/reductase SDR [Colletotrichum orchidophilum]